MGHIRLGTLPKTQKWNQVVNLIASGGDVERIAAASADAAEHGLERAAHDEGLAHAFWLLTQIPQGVLATRQGPLRVQEHTQRTRSFLYAALACVVARLLGNNRIRF